MNIAEQLAPSNLDLGLRGMRRDGKYWCDHCRAWKQGKTNGFSDTRGDITYEVVCEICADLLDED
jgi:hypothetical protein